MSSFKPSGHSVTFDVGDGREITIETGRLAKQAHGSAVVRMGNCMILATVVSAYEVKEGQEFFPLSVDYQEKFASSGRIPGNFFRREARLSDYEILISRLVDRALRPRFADNYFNETQVLIYMVSSDENVQPDALAALAASSALTVSDIPFDGPISECRVARIDGKFKVNPSKAEIGNADIDIIMAASMDEIVMIEGEMREVSETDLIEAIKFGHEAIRKQCQAQLDLGVKVGSPEKRPVEPEVIDAELKSAIESLCKDRLVKIAHSATDDKRKRKEDMTALRDEFLATLGEEPEEARVDLAIDYFNALYKKVVREMMLKEGVRLDGRKGSDIRNIWIDVDYLPTAHGSALFTRGETQSLTTCTLGTKDDEQMIDNAMWRGFNRFLLHYNFPAFSTGEIKPNRGPGRREVGHGNLAMRSLKQVLPPDEENPYVIRLVSDILESNGSSSMATVCAGSLALHDAGVKVKSHVSGIAMGLVSDESGNVIILSDILGDEDHLGDMDFKVTGTRNGICACQMDIKLAGLTYEIMAKALEQARQGRLHILDKMYEACPETRADLKPFVPRIEKIYIAKEFIGAVIGPGGKVIQKIQAETGAQIFIEEVGNQGEIFVAAPNRESIDAALAWIKGLTTEPESGESYEGTVKSIMPYGAFVEFLPGKEGLLHISEISWKRLETMDGIFNEGDKVKVKLLEVDKRSGKYRLSRKALLEKPEHSKN
jgi:polyribonucleotide nucleotidyltransferase